MQCFLDNNIIPYYKMKTLNKCRLFLQAFTIADISTGDGMRITKNTWEGKKSNPIRTIKSWHLWGTPTTSEWKVLRKSLTTTFFNHTANIYLQHPLGRWLCTPINKWNIDPSVNSLQEKVTINEQRQRLQLNRSKFMPRYKEQEFTTHQRPTITACIPTTIFKDHNMIFQEGTSTINL